MLNNPTPWKASTLLPTLLLLMMFGACVYAADGDGAKKPADGEAPAKGDKPADKGADQAPGDKPVDANAPVDHSASDAAKQEWDDARTALYHTEDALASVKATKVKAFRSGGDYSTALAEFQQAQVEYDFARRPVREALKASERYQDASTIKLSAQNRISRLRDDNMDTYERVLPVAETALKAGCAMTAAEAEAMANDPTVSAARDRLLKAAASLTNQNQMMGDAVTQDPDLQQAQKDFDSARSRFKAAAQALAEANEQERLSEIARQKRIDQSLHQRVASDK